MYVSGCLGFALGSGKLVPGGAKEQTEAALNHMKNILIASDSNMSNVLKTTIYLQDYNDFASVNEAYKQGKPVTISQKSKDPYLSSIFFAG